MDFLASCLGPHPTVVMPRSSPNSPAHWIRSGLNVMGWFAPFAIWCQNLSLDSGAIVEGSNTAANIRLVVLKGSKLLIFSGHLDLQLLLPQGGRVGEGPGDCEGGPQARQWAEEKTTRARRPDRKGFF